MGKNCLVEYLTPACEKCPDWCTGGSRGYGCGTYRPIMECEHFRKMYEEEEAKNILSERKMPDPIYRKTASGEIILLEATSKKSYSKGWYTIRKTHKVTPPQIRRVKHVTLPVHPDCCGYPVHYVDTLFELLLKNGYSKYTPDILE